MRGARLPGRDEAGRRLVGPAAGAGQRPRRRRGDPGAQGHARLLPPRRLLHPGVRQQAGPRHPLLRRRRRDDLRHLPRLAALDHQHRPRRRRPATARSPPSSTRSPGRRRGGRRRRRRDRSASRASAACWSTRSTTRWSSATASTPPASTSRPGSSTTSSRVGQAERARREAALACRPSSARRRLMLAMTDPAAARARLRRAQRPPTPGTARSTLAWSRRSSRRRLSDAATARARRRLRHRQLRRGAAGGHRLPRLRHRSFCRGCCGAPATPRTGRPACKAARRSFLSATDRSIWSCRPTSSTTSAIAHAFFAKRRGCCAGRQIATVTDSHEDIARRRRSRATFRRPSPSSSSATQR